MSSPEHKKEFQTLDRLIKFCEKHDEKHAIISNEILPIYALVFKGVYK